jgi:hypothetical protein
VEEKIGMNRRGNSAMRAQREMAANAAPSADAALPSAVRRSCAEFKLSETTVSARADYELADLTRLAAVINSLWVFKFLESGFGDGELDGAGLAVAAYQSWFFGKIRYC